MNNNVRRCAAYQVTRHTSHPTAADFAPDVSAKEDLAWLGKLEPRWVYLLHRIRALTFQWRLVRVKALHGDLRVST